MEKILFKVTDTYLMSSGDLILLPGLGSNYVPIGTPVIIIRPDRTQMEVEITGIAFGDSLPVSIGKIRKEDVPVGSELWAR